VDRAPTGEHANGQRYLYNHGPERQVYSDPDAAWGHRSAVSTRQGGGFYGYKIHPAVCARTGLPLARQIERGARNESLYVAPLLDAVKLAGSTPRRWRWIAATTTTASTAIATSAASPR
jgi:hypothetical protein